MFHKLRVGGSNLAAKLVKEENQCATGQKGQIVLLLPPKQFKLIYVFCPIYGTARIFIETSFFTQSL